jgi:putative hydrolase of the HAD superfamily
MALAYAVFDLDDTLYCCESGLMQEIGRRIQAWLRTNLGLDAVESVDVRRKYFLQYGTTLGGLIEEREIDVDDYLLFVHDIPLEQYVTEQPGLSEMLASVRLRKVVYTNATREYGERVLERLGVLGQFERVIGIREVGLRNKPYRDAYERLLGLLGAAGPECVMIEDSARNLRPAKALGMTTVLVRPPGAPQRFSDLADLNGEHDEVVDYVVGSVLEVGPLLARLAGSAA